MMYLYAGRTQESTDCVCFGISHSPNRTYSQRRFSYVNAADSGNNLERKLKKTWRTKTKLAASGKYGKITFREHGQFPLKLRTVIAEFTNFGQSGRFERDTCEFSLAKINLSTNLTKHLISFSRLFAFQNNLSANF